MVVTATEIPVEIWNNKEKKVYIFIYISIKLSALTILVTTSQAGTDDGKGLLFHYLVIL